VKTPSNILRAVLTFLSVAIIAVGVFIYIQLKQSEHLSALESIYFFTGEPFVNLQLEKAHTDDSELIPLYVDSGSVVDYVKRGVKEFALIQNTDGEVDMFVRSTGANWTQYTVDGGIKLHLDVSSDGSLVSFTKRIETVPSSRQDFYDDLTAWDAYVFETSNGASSRFANGFAPQFFTRDGLPFLLFVDPDGITIAKLGTDDRQSATFYRPYDGHHPPRVSPDGEYLAVYNPRGTYDIFPIETLSPLIIGDTVGSLPQDTSVMVFSRTAIYAARNINDGDSVLFSISRDLSDDTVVLKEFNKIFSYRLIFNDL